MNALEQWNLSRLGENLYWDGYDLAGLAARFGTPLYVVSRKRLERSFEDMKGAFRAEGLDTEIFFSFKTNPIPSVCRVLTESGAGAEVISEFELWLAKKLGLEGSKILVNGSIKSRALLRDAVECGARMINVETGQELVTLRDIAKKTGRKANIGLRINPGLKKKRLHFTTSTGQASSPIGFKRESEEWRQTLRLLAESRQFLNFRGIQFHIGTGIQNAAPFGEAVTNALGFLDALLKNGLRPDILDIGGGFSIPTLKEASAWEALRLFVWNKPQEPPAAKKGVGLLSEVARIVAGRLLTHTEKWGIPPLRIFTEPGRSLSGSSQILLLRVNSVRDRGKGSCSVFCDGGAMSLSSLLISEYHEIFVANKPENGTLKKYDIYGSLPTTIDVVSLGRKLPALARDDVLAVVDTGAYFTSLGNNFAGPRPAIVMLDRGTPVLIRRRETFEDLVARDIGFSEGHEKDSGPREIKNSNALQAWR